MAPRMDRTARRAQVVDAYLTLVARDGIEEATSRALAAEVGVSTGALWHWFDDFDEVLFESFRAIFERTNERIARAVTDRRGLVALVGMMTEIFPLTKQTNDEALVVVSFWGRVPGRPELGVFQTKVEQLWREEICTHLEHARDDGELRVDAPVVELADVVLVLAVGQQVEHVLGTVVADPDRQWQLVDAVLGPWCTAGRPPTPRRAG